jgi:polyphosphate glucokinase
MNILGIDIGGSGIKGAPVDVDKGELVVERFRVKTPQPSTPDAVGDAVAEIVKHFNWSEPIGVTYPGVVKNGMTLSAANVDTAWMNYDGEKMLREKTGCPVLLLNDADAAGIAEMHMGAGKGRKGSVIMLTFGTGIGSAFFTNGVLYPNTELGHMEVRGKDAEHRAAARIRDERNLTWEEWAERVNEFLARVDKLFSPDLIIFGGGVSKRFEKFSHLLKSQAEIVPARYFNDAGIVGAALAAKVLTADNQLPTAEQ